MSAASIQNVERSLLLLVVSASDIPSGVIPVTLSDSGLIFEGPFHDILNVK